MGRGWLVGVVLLAWAPGAGADEASLTACRQVAKAFMGEMQGELAAALERGGPEGALEVCRVKARAVAQRHGQKAGIEVGRTSSRVRNPRNAPDPWEKAGLAEFESRAARGEAVSALERSEVVTVKGLRTFRYLRAVPMGEPCLGCHGPAVPEGFLARIRELYPKDRAVGFAVGEVRGAVSLAKPLD